MAGKDLFDETGAGTRHANNEHRQPGSVVSARRFCHELRSVHVHQCLDAAQVFLEIEVPPGQFIALTVVIEGQVVFPGGIEQAPKGKVQHHPGVDIHCRSPSGEESFHAGDCFLAAAQVPAQRGEGKRHIAVFFVIFQIGLQDSEGLFKLALFLQYIGHSCDSTGKVGFEFDGAAITLPCFVVSVHL